MGLWAHTAIVGADCWEGHLDTVLVKRKEKGDKETEMDTGGHEKL
jgi:hypothetical protein